MTVHVFLLSADVSMAWVRLNLTTHSYLFILFSVDMFVSVSPYYISEMVRYFSPIEMIVKNVYLKLLERGHEKHFSLQKKWTLTGVPESTMGNIFNKAKAVKTLNDRGA